jgi:hypothetical protein
MKEEDYPLVGEDGIRVLGVQVCHFIQVLELQVKVLFNFLYYNIKFHFCSQGYSLSWH